MIFHRRAYFLLLPLLNKDNHHLKLLNLSNFCKYPLVFLPLQNLYLSSTKPLLSFFLIFNHISTICNKHPLSCNKCPLFRKGGTLLINNHLLSTKPKAQHLFPRWERYVPNVGTPCSQHGNNSSPS